MPKGSTFANSNSIDPKAHTYTYSFSKTDFENTLKNIDKVAK